LHNKTISQDRSETFGGISQWSQIQIHLFLISYLNHIILMIF